MALWCTYQVKWHKVYIMWPLHLFAHNYNYVVFIPPGVAAQVLHQKSEPEVKLVGNSIQLQCAVSGYDINNHHLYWVRKAPGKSLVIISGFRTGYTTYIADSFKGRVTPSTEGSTALLNIHKLEYSDSGLYYCARAHW